MAKLAFQVCFVTDLKNHYDDAEIYSLFKKLENGTWEIVTNCCCHYNSEFKEFIERVHFRGWKQDKLEEVKINYYTDNHKYMNFICTVFFESDHIYPYAKMRKAGEKKLIEIMEKFLIINNHDFLKKGLELFKSFKGKN